MRSRGGSPRCPVCLVTDLRVSHGKIMRRRPGIRLDRRILSGRVLSWFRGSLRVEPSIPLLLFYHPDCGGCAKVPTCGHVLDKTQAAPLSRAARAARVLSGDSKDLWERERRDILWSLFIIIRVERNSFSLFDTRDNLSWWALAMYIYLSKRMMLTIM